MLPSNLTLDELIRLGKVPDELLPLIDAWHRDRQSDLAAAVDKETEILLEQLHFAKQLVDAMEDAVKDNTRMSDFKKAFNSLLDNTLFER